MKLEGNLNKMQSMYESKLTDLKAIRSALANREEQIKVQTESCMKSIGQHKHSHAM